MADTTTAQTGVGALGQHQIFRKTPKQMPGQAGQQGEAIQTYGGVTHPQDAHLHLTQKSSSSKICNLGSWLE